jgi:hypothetical protein
MLWLVTEEQVFGEPYIIARPYEGGRHLWGKSALLTLFQLEELLKRELGTWELTRNLVLNLESGVVGSLSQVFDGSKYDVQIG